jgi:cyclophilin family peptidyl-prolyl cis-trans isomerase
MNRTCSRIALVATLVGVALLSRSVYAADAAERVRFVTTAGVIELELDAARAPQTVANILDLVDAGFYDGLVFHRIVPGFVIQAGGYDAKLARRDAPRTVPNEAANGLKNRKGTVAMARLPDPDSAGAQFFVNLQDNTNLDRRPGNPGYTVFGKVTSGMDVVNAIAEVPTQDIEELSGVPVVPVIITNAERIR